MFTARMQCLSRHTMYNIAKQTTRCPSTGRTETRYIITTAQHRQGSEISTDPGITAVSSQTYEAPLKKTVRNIKLFSLSSLALSTLISPVFLLIESEIEPVVRAVMVGIALGTSALSTGVIQWVLKPYVIQGRALNSIGTGRVEMHRLSWLGRQTATVVNPEDLTVDKNGRMFSNLKAANGDCFYVHETTKFWQELTGKAKKSESANQV